jgi:hypothetical protein
MLTSSIRHGVDEWENTRKLTFHFRILFRCSSCYIVHLGRILLYLKSDLQLNDKCLHACSIQCLNRLTIQCLLTFPMSTMAGLVESQFPRCILSLCGEQFFLTICSTLKKKLIMAHIRNSSAHGMYVAICVFYCDVRMLHCTCYIKRHNLKRMTMIIQGQIIL